MEKQIILLSMKFTITQIMIKYILRSNSSHNFKKNLKEKLAGQNIKLYQIYM